MLNILNPNKMTMARRPEDTTRDEEEVQGANGVEAAISGAPKAANESGVIPVLPPIPDKVPTFPPYPTARHAPTTPISFSANPGFVAGPLRTPTAPAPLDPVDISNPSTTPTDKFVVTPRTPTAAYATPSPFPAPAPAARPAPDSMPHPLSTTDKADSLLTAFVDDEDKAPKAVDIIRLAIAGRGNAHFLSIKKQTIDESTIFSSITEEFRNGNLSGDDAFTLMSEYIDSLKQEEMFSVFMDILVAESNGSISKEEAKNYAKSLRLSDADKMILDTIYTRLTGEQAPMAIPARAHSKRAEKDTVQDSGVSAIHRLFSSRLALAAGVVLAIGSTLGIGYKLGQKEEPVAELKAPLVPVAPATPEEAQASTLKQVVAVEKPKAPKAETVAPKNKAPKIIAPTSQVAPKVKVATSAPSSAPVAPKILPRVEKHEAISIPVITKTNSEGVVVIDGIKSITVWKKLGYSVGMQSNATGKVFTLTSKEGKKVTVNDQGLQKGQTTIEIK